MIILYAVLYFLIGTVCLAMCEGAWSFLNEFGYFNHRLAILLALLWPLVLTLEIAGRLRFGYLRVRNWMWHRKRLKQ